MSRLVLVLFAMCLCFGLCAKTPQRQRTQNTVRSERQAATRKIEQSRRQLSANEEQTRRELNNLQSLEGEIRLRESEILKLNDKLKSLQNESKTLTDSIKANEESLVVLRQSYARALRALRRQRQMADDAAFVVSSSSFAQARSRVRYLKELSVWQKSKTDQIRIASEQLARRKARLDTLRTQITSGLDSIENEHRLLGERKHQADAVVGSLKRQSRNLQRVIGEQQRLVAKLDKELDRIIEEEARAEAEARRKAEAEAKAQQPVQQPSTAKAEPAAPVDRLTEPFERCKGRLPLPIDHKATITSTFGRHTHQTLDRVTVQNNGVDFETTPGASARAVYDGTVSMIIVMEGYHNVVLLRHGEYLTVYAGLSDLRVRKGDKVKAGQLLGNIFSDPSDGNRTRLHFEVRHEKDKLDPAQWLKP